MIGSPGGFFMETLLKLKRHGALLVLIALSGWMPASAEMADPRFTMTVIVDDAHGGRVAAGKYESAISRITANRRVADPFARHTNLCVAYTKIGDMERATDSCETALTFIQQESPEKKAGYTTDRRYRRYLALALSNLGVLDVAKGTPEVARLRFEEAIDVDADAPEARTNLDRLIAGL
jgi:tetratricopeptide (TPR) repeat protein